MILPANAIILKCLVCRPRESPLLGSMGRLSVITSSVVSRRLSFLSGDDITGNGNGNGNPRRNSLREALAR